MDAADVLRPFTDNDIAQTVSREFSLQVAPHKGSYKRVLICILHELPERTLKRRHFVSRITWSDTVSEDPTDTTVQG